VLSFRVSPHTAVARISYVPFCMKTTNQPILAQSLNDYTLLVKGTPAGPLNALNIGGLPASRVYMRFNVPAFLIDSVDVVRATLLLTQIPNLSLDPADSMSIVPNLSLAGGVVTDVAKASQIIAVVNTDTLAVVPGGSGLKTLEVATVIGLWRLQVATETPRALVLISTREGQSALQSRFYSIEAAPDLRPRLRISYSARKSTGLP